MIKTNKIRKVPTVLQMEAVECGAASLSMILEYYGVFLPLERLRLECGVSRDGAKAANIIKAAKKFGLQAKGFKCEPKDLAQLSFPAIIHWNFNHFLVLEGHRGKYFYLNDPACGRRKVSEQEFDEAFTGVVVTFEKMPDFKPIGKPVRLFQLLKPLLNRNAIFLLLFAGLALTFPGILLALMSRIFLDTVITTDNQRMGILLAIGVFAVAVLRNILQSVQANTIAQLQIRLEVKLGANTIWKLLHLSQRFFSQRYPGEIVDKAVICRKAAQIISKLLAEIVTPLFMMAFSLILMIFYNVNLALVCVLLALCNIVILRFCISKVAIENQKSLLDGGKLVGVEMNGLQAIETLKACGMEDDFFRRWLGFFSKSQNIRQKLEIFRYTLLFVPNFLSFLGSVILLIYGGFLVMKGCITPGILMAFFLLSSEFLSPVEHLSESSIALQELKADLLRLSDVLSYSENNLIDSAECDLPENNNEIAVEFKNVSFGYNLLEVPLIEKISFQLRDGSSIAFVGGSGSGKSTIAKLLTGTLTQWSGNIGIYGKNRRDYSADELSMYIASVDQDICLFEASILDNITLWDTTISMNDVIQAAKDACIHDIILNRPGGYDCLVAEGGSNFSGGEIQRLEIARALVGNPKILIMDEATSALDTETERRICENIRRRGCACIIVAHRLSTIKNCEKIMVMKHGKVEGFASHEELLKECESYKELLQALQGDED